MPATPYAKILVSVSGGANTSGGLEVASAATIQFSPESTVGWLRARWELIDYPEGFATPAGWSLAADGTIYYSAAFTPPLITLPANTVQWGKWFPRLRVNEQIDTDVDLRIQTDENPAPVTLLDDATMISMLSPKGQRDVAARESTQMTTATTRIKSWLRDLQRNLRQIEAISIGTPAGSLKTVQYNNGGLMGGIPELTYEGSGRIQLDIATGYLAYGSGAVPASGMVRIPYSAGTQVIFGRKDSGGTDRSWVVFTGNNLQVGNSSGFAMDLQGSTVTITAASSASINATTSIGLASTTTTTITATTTLSMTGTTGGFLAFGPTPATRGFFRVPANPGDVLVAGTKSLISTDNTDLWIGSDTTYLNGVTGYIKYTAVGGHIHVLNGSFIGSIDSGGYCIAINQQNWMFGTNVGGYGSGVCVGHWRAATTNPTGSPTTGVIMYVDKDSFYPKFKMPSGDVAIVDIPDPSHCGLRLSARTAEPIPISDVATATSVFLIPYLSGTIYLYDATAGHWQARISAEVNVALGTLTSGKNYDVWAEWNGSAVVLTLSTAWTNDTTRADALARQNGVLVKSGTPAKRYVGTIRTISTTQITDTLVQRYCYSWHCQTIRELKSTTETTNSWTYATAAYRAQNNAATNKFEFVSGQATPLSAESWVSGQGSATGQSCLTGVGVDSTTVNSAQLMTGSGQQVANTGSHTNMARYSGVPALGYHAITPLEYATAATLTFFGDAGTSNLIQTGMLGRMMM